MSQRLIDRLPYLLNGTKITANACLMHDGAAFVVLFRNGFAEQGRKAECRFRFGTAIGDDPMSPAKSAVSAAKNDTCKNRAFLGDRCF